MSRRRRRDDGNLAIFALPYQHPCLAMACTAIPIIGAAIFMSWLNQVVETDPTGLALQVAQQIATPVMCILTAIAAYGWIAMLVHLWWMHNGREYE